MTEHGITVEDVWKKFHRGELHDSLRDLVPAVAKRLLGRGPRRDQLDADDFWALREVSFQVRPGEAVGIIGPNGSGKSTMLKILNGILRPNRGRIEVTGRIGALIEIAAGFHPDLTGRENIFLQGAIMGMKRQEIARKFDEIVDFSGIAEFIDTPVKRYSSGMNARLGFSIAAHLDPEVLLIDEVLAVGDFSFQQRAFEQLKRIVKSGIPVVVVSHQLGRISALCDRAILLNRGEVVLHGEPHECIAAYLGNDSKNSDAAPSVQCEGIRIESLSVTNSHVESGEQTIVNAMVTRSETTASDRFSVGLHVKSVHNGALLYARGTGMAGIARLPSGTFQLQFALQMNLPAGVYLLQPVVWDVDQKHLHAGNSVPVTVECGRAFRGSVQLNSEITVIEDLKEESANDDLADPIYSR